MTNHVTIPWVLCLVTALWFGLVAYRARRAWILGAIGGGAFALVTATLIFGLGQAMAIPFSDADGMRLHIEWGISSAAVIAVVGWVWTRAMGRQRPAPRGQDAPPAVQSEVSQARASSTAARSK